MIRRLTLAVGGLLASATIAAAQNTVADFYKGRNLDIYVGYSAGGVYDIYAHLLTRFMGRHIPGNPTLVPRTMDGAGSLRLSNWLYQLAPKDGSAIGTFGRGNAFYPLLGQPGTAFDPTKFNWIGSTNDEVSVCATMSSSGVTNLEQMYRQELLVGSTGGGADDEQFPKIMNGVLGTKMRIIPGYPGGNDIKIAMQRGEVNGRCGWSWSSVKATEGQWLKDKTISIVIQLALRKHPDLPDVPLIMDLAKNDEERQIYKVIFGRQVMGWPYAAPPGVPRERVSALRNAFDQTMADADFLSEAARLNLEVAPVTGDRIQGLVEELYRTTTPELVSKINTILK